MKIEDLKQIAEKTLSSSMKLGSDYAEVRVHGSRGRGIILRNGVPQPSLIGESFGLSLRVMVHGSLAFASTNKLDQDTLKELPERCIKIARSTSERVKDKVFFTSAKAVRKKWSANEKQKAEDASFAEMLSLLRDIDSELVSTGVRIQSRYISLDVEVEEKFIVNSDGSRNESRVPRVSFHSSLIVHENNESLHRFISEGRSGGLELFKELEFGKKLIKEATTMKKILLSSVSTPKEKVNVILSPELCGIAAHESVGHPFEADRILGREGAQAGESYLKKDCIGKVVGSKEANVSDDPTLPGSYGFYLLDDECVQARKRELIKEGMIKELLHNRETAHNFGTESNGASRASSFDREPIVRMANTYVEPGDYTFEELLKEAKDGVYIKSFMEWNIDDKRMNQRYVGLEAYLVKNGELSSFVRSPVLEITTQKLWGSVKARTKELEFEPATCGKGDPMQGIPVWHGGPNMLLEGIILGRR